MKKLSILISGISLFTSSLVLAASPQPPSQELLLSPVGVMNYMKALADMRDFKSRKDVQAMAEFYKIYYDRIINRPWGKQYWPEASQRWQNLRGELCPGLEAFCAISGKNADLKDQTAIMDAVKSDKVWNELTQHFLKPKSGNPYYLLRVQMPDSDTLDLQNVLFSNEERDFKENQVSLWGMKEDHIQRKELENVQLADVHSYFSGFNSSDFPAYISLVDGHPDQTVINLDKLQYQAAVFGSNWKVEVDRPVPPAASEMPMLYFEKVMLHKIYDKYQSAFAAKYDELFARLKKMPADTAKPILERFAKERANHHYPDEVFQFVTYDLFHSMLQTEADYYSLAASQRKGVEPMMKQWESLLSLQAKTDPRWLFYFVVEEALSPDNLPLAQFSNPQELNIFLYEEVEAIVGLGRYKNAGLFPEFKYALKNPDVFDADYLKSNNPDLLKELTDTKTGKIRDVYSMSDSDQIKYFKDYLYQPDGKPRMNGFVRLAMTMVLNLTDADAARLADQVHLAHKDSFIAH